MRVARRDLRAVNSSTPPSIKMHASFGTCEYSMPYPEAAIYPFNRDRVKRFPFDRGNQDGTRSSNLSAPVTRMRKSEHAVALFLLRVQTVARRRDAR